MRTMKGYVGKILSVDLSKGEIIEEKLNLDLARRYIGGRGFGAKMIYENTGPRTNPLGPQNVIVYATGPLNGTLAPGCGRLHICTKSPLTSIFGWSNVGGHFSPELKYAGYDAIIVRGRAEKPVYLWINDGRAEIMDAGHLWGKSTHDTGKQIIQDVGDRKAEVLSIGQAGENLVKFAGLMSIGRLSGKAAARTGVGAVMGSKKLKAIAVRGARDVEVADPVKFKKVVNDVIDVLRKEPATIVASMFGTSFLVDSLGNKGSLPTWNYQKGEFEHQANINAEAMRDRYLWKAQSCSGCWLGCCRYVVVKDGPAAGYAGKGPEFETLAMVGSNLGIGDLSAVIAIHDLFDKYGMDATSGGTVIGFAMECYQRGILTKKELDGLDLTWGNHEAVLELARKIAFREGIGKILAEGVKKAAKIIGKGSKKYAMHIKGLEIIGGDPRGQTGFTLGYAVCNRGACHLGALPVFEYTGAHEEGKKFFGSSEAADRFGIKGKGRLVKWQEELMAVEDSLVVCKLVYSHFLTTPKKLFSLSFDKQAKLYEAATGIAMSGKKLQKAGERIVNLERAFNVLCGITRKDDTLPGRFLREPLKEGGSAGYLVDFEPLLDEYYTARGWNKKDGIPSGEKLVGLGLKHVADGIKKFKS